MSDKPSTDVLNRRRFLSAAGLAGAGLAGGGLPALQWTGWTKVGVGLFSSLVIGFAGATSTSTITPGALESSNVDISQEFTNMIIAQRGFQASSRVITTSDQVLEDLVNIKR